MDKKFILIGIIALVLSVGAVSAVNLENKNFDDAFSMKVPKNSNFSIQAMNQSAGFNFSSNFSLLNSDLGLYDTIFFIVSFTSFPS